MDDKYESKTKYEIANEVSYALDKLAECAVYPGAGRDP